MEPSAPHPDGPGYTWSADDPGTHRHHPRWVLPALVVPILLLIVANNVGAVLLTNRIEPSGVVPGALEVLALNSTNKVLLATGFQTEAMWFVVVATLRLLAPDPLFYLMGLLYRIPALRWGRRVYPGADRLFDLFEHEDHRGVRRLLDGLVVIMPNNPVCLLAGVAGMPPVRFAVLNVLGTLGRVVLFRQLSFAFEDEIVDVMDFVARYQRWALLLTVAVVVASLVVQARRLVVGTEALAEEEG